MNQFICIKNYINIILLIFLFYGCTNKEFEGLPDENPDEIMEISLAIAFTNEYLENYKEELIAICLPLRSNKCPTTAFVFKSVNLIRLDSDEKESTALNIWDAKFPNNIWESIQGKTFAGIAQNVDDNFNDFTADEYLISERTNETSIEDINSFIIKNKKAKIYFYTESEPDSSSHKFLSNVSYFSSIPDFKKLISDYLCSNKKDSGIPIVIFYKPNISELFPESDTTVYKLKLKSLKQSIEELKDKKGYNDLISKYNELSKLVDDLIEIIEIKEREKFIQDLNNKISLLEKKIDELNGNGGTKPPPPSTTTIPPKHTLHFDYGTYIGEIKNGKMHGWGEFRYSKRWIISEKDWKKRYAEAGDILKGTWNEGNFSTGKLYGKNDKFKETIIIGQK